MGRPRSELQLILKEFTENVYFQPPNGLKMKYPCIVYQRNDAETQFASNDPYRFTQRYQVTVIDQNPDSDIREKVAGLPMCLYNRFMTVDNLNHDVFNLYF